MEMDTTKKYPVVEVDGFIETGKQFDLDIKLPEDERNVIFGIIRDRHGKPIEDAVVKLIEISYEKGEEVRKPVSHTFTDEYGQFVFGPLCPEKKYAIDIWVNRVKHVKICAKCNRKGRCLKGVDLDCDKHDKYNDYDKCDKYDKYDDYDKKDEDDKQDKYDEYNKYNKCDKYDDYDKDDKDDKDDKENKDDKYDKNDKEDKHDNSPCPCDKRPICGPCGNCYGQR